MLTSIVLVSAFSFGANGLLITTNDGAHTWPASPAATTIVQVASFSMENASNSWLLILSPTVAIVQGTDYGLAQTSEFVSLVTLPKAASPKKRARAPFRLNTKPWIAVRPEGEDLTITTALV